MTARGRTATCTPMEAATRLQQAEAFAIVADLALSH
jgi:hypothetical protein